jgi:uncharacterized damage-inducible protein DinB
MKPTLHPLIHQLHFTRREFMRAIKGVREADAQRRLMPMNCISWNIGHLAWQEQRYFIYFPTGQHLFPEIDKQFAYGAPASTPPLGEMVLAWQTIAEAADSWLETVTPAKLQERVVLKGKPTTRIYGNLLQRLIYHYWYHIGENLAIRQQLGHTKLPVFVGNIDNEAPYQPEKLLRQQSTQPKRAARTKGRR